MESNGNQRGAGQNQETAGGEESGQTEASFIVRHIV
jgi:hypothetical protein